MKIECDLCGGQLQMNPGAQGATCMNCGMSYPMEVLREKLTKNNVTAQVSSAQDVEKPQEQKATESLVDVADEAVYEPDWKVVDPEPEVYDAPYRILPSKEKVLSVWQQYLPQVKPQYSVTMKLHELMKNCYFYPNIANDVAERASRYLTKGTVAPQDILGHYSVKPQGGLAGIVVTEHSIFLPIGIGLEYMEIPYASLERAEIKKDNNKKMRTTLSLFSTGEITLFYKDGSMKNITLSANYRPEPIVQALNELAK